jgi:hypothetical protein
MPCFEYRVQKDMANTYLDAGTAPARFSAIFCAAILTAWFLSVNGPSEVPAQLPRPAQEWSLFLQEF